MINDQKYIANELKKLETMISLSSRSILRGSFEAKMSAASRPKIMIFRL